MNNQTALTVQKLDGFEIVQHEGKPYVPGYRSAARIVSIGLEKPISDVQIKRTVNQLLGGATKIQLIEAQIQTDSGVQGATLIPHQFIGKLIRKYNDPLADRLDEAGTVVFLNKLVGNEVQINSAPKTRRQLAEEQLKMIIELEEKEAKINFLGTQVQVLSETVDELFSYSSIIRVAKFNKCSEKLFSWYRLKSASVALDLEIKSAPCPRFGTKNLYDHRAWEYAYPDVKVPADTTLALA